jgi:excisionase family DNA binding protein
VYLSRHEAAKVLNVHVATIDRHIRAGLIKAEKGPGRLGAIRISEESVAEYVKQQETFVPVTADQASSGGS